MLTYRRNGLSRILVFKIQIRKITMSELDKEFEATVEQVNAKLAESAKALREAHELAQKAGFKNGLIFSQWAREKEPIDWNDDDQYYAMEARYGKIDVSDLEDAMSEAGWQPSSSYC